MRQWSKYLAGLPDRRWRIKSTLSLSLFHNMARPSKYTEERARKIIDALRAGNTRQAAYTYGGIDAKTFASWLRRFSHFSQEVAYAEAEHEVASVATLKKAAQGWDTRVVKRKTITVFQKRITRHADGTIVEEPVALEQTTTEEILGKEFDWHASLEWLKRRRRIEWGDTIDLGKIPDEQLLRLIEAAGGGE